MAVRRYHQALFIVLACCLALSAGLLRAVLVVERPLTSGELAASTRWAVDRAVGEAIEVGGLPDAEAFVRDAIEDDLRRQGFDARIVLRRPNDLNRRAAFHFFVGAGALSIRFDVDGTRDPLLAIRLGVDVRIVPDPNHPYERHRDPMVMDACLAARYYHLASDGPDLFARLENRTSDPFHFGFETFLSSAKALAVDHTFLDAGTWGLGAEAEQRYGLD